MTSRTSMLHVRVDEHLKAEAAATLANVGLTVSDAVRILLTRVNQEGGLPAGLATDPDVYDAWFIAKVREAMQEKEPAVNHQRLMDETQQLIDRKRRAETGMDSGSQTGSAGDN